MGDRKTVLRKSIAYTTAKLNSSSPKNEENNESSLISPQPSVSRPFIDPVIVGNMANMAQFGITGKICNDYFLHLFLMKLYEI